MKKNDFEKYAIDYLKGRLDLREKIEFEQLLNDPNLKRELDELKELMDISTSWKAINPPSELRVMFFESLSMHQSRGTNSTFSVMEKIDSFLGIISEYHNLRRLALSVLLVLMGGIMGYFIRTNSGKEVSGLTEQMQKLEMSIAQTQLKSYSPSDRMKGVSYASIQTSESPQLIKELIYLLDNDESIHIRIATAQALYRFVNWPKVHLALENALVNEKDILGKMNLVSLVETFNPQLARQELTKLLDRPLNPELRNEVQKMIKN